MAPLSTNLFTPLLKTIKGRPETGRWLRAMPAHRIRDLLDPYASSEMGGRVNPPGSFPVLYAAADEVGCRPLLMHRSEPETVIAVFSVSLSRILDLADPSVRRKVGVRVKDLGKADGTRVSQAIGVAAYNEG